MTAPMVLTSVQETTSRQARCTKCLEQMLVTHKVLVCVAEEVIITLALDPIVVTNAAI